MTARRGGAGMIVACVPVPPAVRFPEMIIGIIRVLPIPPCGCRCATHECRIGLRQPPGVRGGPPRGVAASPRDRTPRPRAPPPRVGRRVRRAMPVGPGGRPGNAATGDPYRSVARCGVGADPPNPRVIPIRDSRFVPNCEYESSSFQPR